MGDGPRVLISDRDVGAVPRDTLPVNGKLFPGQTLVSKNGRVRFAFQKDGNLVVYGDRRALWHSETYGKGATYLYNQGDGNIVIYAAGNRPLWASNTNTGRAGRILVQNDANVVQYVGNSRQWATDTNGFTDKIPHGGWLEKAFKTVGEGLASPVTAIGHAASDIAQGKNVLDSLKSAATEAISPAVAILKPLSPALNVAAGLASLVPGLGTVAGGALGMAAALGRGASVADMALSAARGALPGGPIAKVAFDVAVGVATGQPATGIALAQIRNAIPGGAVAKAAYDAGLAVAYHATPAETKHAVRALPTKQAQATFAKAVLVAHAVRKAPPQVHEIAHRRARAKTKPKNLTPRARTWVKRAVLVHARTRLDTRGIDPGGRSYTVEKGDSAWRIAQNLTGDGNHHWRELVAANHPPKKLQGDGNFYYLKVGEVLKLPDSWIGKFVRVTNPKPATVLPGSDQMSLPPQPAARQVPQVAPPPPAPPTPAPTAVIPPSAPAPLPQVAAPGPATTPTGERDDPAAIAQAKTIMVAWEHTDGAAAAGLPDYGGTADDQSPIWGVRDGYELRAFTVWSNAHGTALSLLGDLTQAKLDALVAWAENRASQLAGSGGSVSPSGQAAPAPTGGTSTTAVPDGMIPASPKPSAPDMAQASIVPISIPETLIDDSGAKKSGEGFGWGIAALVLLGVGAVAMSSSEKKRRAA